MADGNTPIVIVCNFPSLLWSSQIYTVYIMYLCIEMCFLGDQLLTFCYKNRWWWCIITITHSNCLVKFTIEKTEILLKVTLNTITQLHIINILNSAYVSLLSNRKWDPCAHLLIAGYDQKTSVNSAAQRLTHACQTVCVRYKQPLTLLIWFWF